MGIDSLLQTFCGGLHVLVHCCQTRLDKFQRKAPSAVHPLTTLQVFQVHLHLRNILLLDRAVVGVGDEVPIGPEKGHAWDVVGDFNFQLVT